MSREDETPAAKEAAVRRDRPVVSARPDPSRAASASAPVAAASVRVVDLAAVVDHGPMNLRRLLVLGLLLLSLFVDGYDLAIIAFVAPAVAKSWRLAGDVMAMIFSAGVGGMVLGSLVMGALADWRGRRPAMLASMALAAIGLAGSTTAGDATALALWRFATGIGVGAIVPVALVLAEEYAPRRLRAPVLAALLLGIALGSSGAAGWLASYMLPVHGWRWLLGFGGVASGLLTVVLALWLPESLKHLFARRPRAKALAATARRLAPEIGDGALTFTWTGEAQTPGRIPYRLLFAAERRWTTPLLWTSLFCAQLTVYGLTLWLPTLLNRAGLGGGTIALAATLFNLSSALGTLAIAGVIQRRGTIVLSLFPLLGVPTVITLAWAGGNPSLLMPLIAVAGVSVGGCLQGLLVVAGQFYPTAIRANAVGAAVFASRFGGVLGPLLLGLMMARGAGLREVFYACAVPLALAVVGIVGLGRLQGRMSRD